MAKFVIEFSDVQNENAGISTVGMLAKVAEGDADNSLAVEYGAAFAAMIHATLTGMASHATDMESEEAFNAKIASGIKRGEGYVEGAPAGVTLQ